MTAPSLLHAQLTKIPVSAKKKIEIDLPDSWLYRALDTDRYYDPTMLQYNLMVSVNLYGRSGDGPVLETARGFMKVLSPGTEPVGLSPDRAIAQYRTSTPENGEPKDDHHWALIERTEKHYWLGLFTLSVLATRSDTATTETVVAMLGDRIQRARFLPL